MSRASASTHEAFDAIVIGSGFGGAVSANRLAKAGLRVLVLERGPWRDSVPVRSMGVERRAPFPYGRKAITHMLHALQWGSQRLSLHREGMFEAFAFPGLWALVASAVGGGSTAYGGLLQPPTNPALWLGRHPDLDPTRVERYYDTVIADMGGVRPSPHDPLPQSVWTHFPAGKDALCHPAVPQPHMGLLIPPTAADAGRTITWGPLGVQRQYAAFDGDSFLGSRGGGKASVDFVYLAPVLGRGAQVRALSLVTAIEPEAGRSGYRVHYTDQTNQTRHTVRAPRVVMAAGTLNTVRLLFANAHGAGGLAPMPALGRNFGANGDLMGLWSRPNAKVPSFVSTPSQGAYVVDGHEATTFGLGGFAGLDTLPLPALLKRRLAQTLLVYGIGVDSGAARLRWHKQRLAIDYDQQGESIYADIRASFATLQAQSGDRVWALPKPLTVHPWGGAGLGADAQAGVVDHQGQVYGNPGLFVADGAALPAAPAGPPAVAIAAWAHHVADGISA